MNRIWLVWAHIKEALWRVRHPRAWRTIQRRINEHQR